jgi:hypothetical protein
MSFSSASSDGGLLLNTVNENIGTFGVLTVNAKGLVTAARVLGDADVTTALGFVPYNAANPAQYVSKSQFPMISGPNGATTLPNGLIFQWGTTTFSGVSSTMIEVAAFDAPSFNSFVGGVVPLVTFPMPFPTAALSCTGTGVNNSDFIEGCEMAVGIVSITAKAVQFSVGRVFGSNSKDGRNTESGEIMWMAIGI